MSVITIRCAGTCGQDIQLTDTGSLYKPDGDPYDIYCHDCYKEKTGE